MTVYIDTSPKRVARMIKLAEGKFHGPATKFLEALLAIPQDLNKEPDTLGEDGMASLPHLLTFKREMKAAGASKVQEQLVVDWVFLNLARQQGYDRDGKRREGL